MAADKQTVVVFDEELSSLDAWYRVAEEVGFTARVCGSAREAVSALTEGAAAFVTILEFARGEASFAAIKAARDRTPPAQVVVLTSNPEWARATLRFRGLPAEILRRPAPPSELVSRLGLSPRGARPTTDDRGVTS